MYKRHFIIIGMILVVALGISLYFASSKNRFITDKITIYYDIPSPDEKFFIITDKDVIKEITTISSNGKFRRVPQSELIDGLCSKFVDFNNGIVIGLYDDIDYGNIEHREVYLNPIGKAVYLPKGLNTYIIRLIEENK